MPLRIRELFDTDSGRVPRSPVQPRDGTVYTAEEAIKAVANRLGYPVLVRPSYVLGGQGMQIAINDEDDGRIHGDHQPLSPRNIRSW